MDGDLAPLAGIVALAREHGARVVVDEAHATGVVGPGGRGLVAELGLEREVDVVIGTLGKALGAYGAFACCDARTAEYLVNRARTLIYSTALPPPCLGAALAGLRLLREEPGLVDRLQANARVLRAALAGARLRRGPGHDADRAAGRGRGGRGHGALRGGPGARRLRPGHPPAHRARAARPASGSWRWRATRRTSCARRRPRSPRPRQRGVAAAAAGRRGGA